MPAHEEVIEEWYEEDNDSYVGYVGGDEDWYVGEADYTWQDPWDSDWCEDWDAWGAHEENLSIFAIGRDSEDVTKVDEDGVTTLMIDSGSQSNACSPSFAPQFATDDTDKARLWDIQNEAIPVFGKKIVDVDFVNDGRVPDVMGHMRMDVSEAGRDVAHWW